MTGNLFQPTHLQSVIVGPDNFAGRTQMRQNNVDFQNRELQTNILALLLVTTRRVTPDDTRVLRHCGFPDSSASPKMVA